MKYMKISLINTIIVTKVKLLANPNNGILSKVGSSMPNRISHANNSVL